MRAIYNGLLRRGVLIINTYKNDRKNRQRRNRYDFDTTAICGGNSTDQVYDRATMLNLMTGLNGYTLCSGIICQDLNGGLYTAIPLDTEDTMTIGYIKRKNIPLSILGGEYVEILKSYKTPHALF